MPRKRKSSPSHDTIDSSPTVIPLNNNHLQQGKQHSSMIQNQEKSLNSTNDESNVTMNKSLLPVTTICYDDINQIILPRNNHKKHDPKFNFSESSTTFVSSVLFNKESIVVFNKSYKLDTFVTNDFVSKRIKDIMPNVLSSSKMSTLIAFKLNAIKESNILMKIL